MGCTCLFRFIDRLVIFDMSFFSIGKRFISRIFLEKNRTCSQGHRFGNEFPLRKEKPRLRRGLLNAVCLIFFRHGLTPAHAGKIIPTMSFQSVWRKLAHPRACGEDLCCYLFNQALKGSPLRRQGRYCSVQTRKAHPRICGDHSLSDPALRIIMDSHPRIRERLNTICASFHQNGFIPAYAGTISSFVPQMLLYQIHPRICGDDQ